MSKKVNEEARSGDRPELDAEVARSGDRAELVVEAARSGDRPELVASPREKAWTETVWGTHVRWACRLCPFDTLDGEEAAAEHFRVEHAPPPPPVVERIQVYDRWGNAV